jgi:hypothetical protein
MIFTSQDGLGNWCFKFALDCSLQWTGAVNRVMSSSGKPFRGVVTQLQLQFAFPQAASQTFHLQRHDLAQLIFSETVEDDLVIESIEEFRSEVPF